MHSLNTTMINLTKLQWIASDPTVDKMIHDEWRTYRIFNDHSISTIFQLNFNPNHELDILASDDLHYMAIYHITKKSTNQSYLHSTIEGNMVNDFMNEFDQLYFNNTFKITNTDDFIHIFENVYMNKQNTIPHTIYLSLSEIDQLYRYTENNDMSETIKNIIKGT